MPQPVNSKGIVVESDRDVAPIDAPPKELERGEADLGGLPLVLPRPALLQRDHLVEMEVAQTAVLLNHGDQLTTGLQPAHGRDMYAQAAGVRFIQDAVRRDRLAVVRDEPREEARGAGGGPAEQTAPESEPPPRKAAVKTPDWIEIRCVDGNGEPHAAAYRLELPDGRVLIGTTQDGTIYISGVDPGDCKLSFHEIDAAAWKKS